MAGHALAAVGPRVPRLALDEERWGRFALRPRLPFNGRPTGPDAAFTAAAKPPPLKALPFDPPTVTDDPTTARSCRRKPIFRPRSRRGSKSYYGWNGVRAQPLL